MSELPANETESVMTPAFLAKVEAERDRKRLKELEDLRDSISHMIVHDLKDPLTVVQASIQYVLEELRENGGYFTDKMEHTLKNTLVHCHRQMGLINDLLDVSRVDLDPIDLRKNKTHFLVLVESCIQAVDAQIEKAEISLVRNFPQFLPPIQLDEEVLRRVLMNLFLNCIRFTKSGGKITVTVNWLDVNLLECIVEDTGMAIPVEDLTRIFDKGFVGDPFGRFRKGQGFGLAYCRLAVEAHGGRIWAERATPRGNRFVFTLPI